jgi:hypothetical protein
VLLSRANRRLLTWRIAPPPDHPNSIWANPRSECATSLYNIACSNKDGKRSSTKYLCALAFKRWLKADGSIGPHRSTLLYSENACRRGEISPVSFLQPVCAYAATEFGSGRSGQETGARDNEEGARRLVFFWDAYAA